MKKKFSPSSRWWLNFFFSFFKNSVLKTHFLMMALRMISFFLSNVCMNFPWTFFVCLLFFKTKIWFFSYVIESSDLCACSIFFFSGPVVRLLCSHKLRPSKRPQCLEKLSDFQSLWFTSFITFEKILQILQMKETLFAVLISRVFFSSFLWLNSLKKTVRLQNFLKLLVQHASAFQLQVLRCYLLHASAVLIGRFQEIAKICFENRQNNWRHFTLLNTCTLKRFVTLYCTSHFSKREWVLECLEFEII